MPRIQMPAKHDDLILQIRAGNLSDGIIGHQVVVLELNLQVHRHFQLLALLNHSSHSVVILGGDSYLRRNDRNVCRPGANKVRCIWTRVRTEPKTKTEVGVSLAPGPRHGGRSNQDSAAITARAFIHDERRALPGKKREVTARETPAATE